MPQTLTVTLRCAKFQPESSREENVARTRASIKESYNELGIWLSAQSDGNQIDTPNTVTQNRVGISSLFSISVTPKVADKLLSEHPDTPDCIIHCSQPRIFGVGNMGVSECKV